MAGLTREQKAARAAAQAGDAEQPPSPDCVFMYRGDERAEVNRNSVEIMEALGWSVKRV